MTGDGHPPSLARLGAQAAAGTARVAADVEDNTAA